MVGFDDFFFFLGKASIAKCVAALVVTQNPAEAQAVVSFYIIFSLVYHRIYLKKKSANGLL